MFKQLISGHLQKHHGGVPVRARDQRPEDPRRREADPGRRGDQDQKDHALRKFS